MSIEQNGQTIGIVTGSAQTGMISITPLFFTGATQQTFTFRAEDANNNIGKEVVNLTIDVPQITISTVDQIDKNTAEVIATLQHDMDEGLVSFQRARNNISQEITWTTEGVSWYSLSPHQTIITWGVFTFGDTLALYAPDGSQLGALDPDNGQITLTPARKNKITLKLDFLMHIPTIEVIDTTNNKELFQINLPGQKLGKITLLQGVPNYQLVALTQSQFGQFQWGNCIKNASDECVIYSNDKWTLYVPGIYGSILGGTYGFDATTNTVQYTITDENGSPIATIHVQIQPLIK